MTVAGPVELVLMVQARAQPDLQAIVISTCMRFPHRLANRYAQVWADGAEHLRHQGQRRAGTGILSGYFQISQAGG